MATLRIDISGDEVEQLLLAHARDTYNLGKGVTLQLDWVNAHAVTITVDTAPVKPANEFEGIFSTSNVARG